MENHVFPRLENRQIDTLGTADVLAVLSPVWTEKHDTARRLRQRIAAVFDWAKGAGHYPHENPVNGLKKALPPVKRRATHMAAMDWRDVPEFMSGLAQREGMSARTLEFLILTATRSGEARGAMWSEIEGDVWTIPADRMKRGLEHRIPLSEAALAVLKKVRGLNSEMVFPSNQLSKDGKARIQSVMVFKSLQIRMKREGFTVHGFRSSFRDWASESAKADREVAEAALSHATGNEVERAYARSDLIERRKVLMEAWSQYCTGATGQVVRMVR
jgi:integrase